MIWDFGIFRVNPAFFYAGGRSMDRAQIDCLKSMKTRVRRRLLCVSGPAVAEESSSAHDLLEAATSSTRPPGKAALP
jgi:hypothetical protein